MEAAAANSVPHAVVSSNAYFCCRIRRQADAGKHQGLNAPEQRNWRQNDQQKKTIELPRQAVEFFVLSQLFTPYYCFSIYTQFPTQLSDKGGSFGLISGFSRGCDGYEPQLYYPHQSLPRSRYSRHKSAQSKIPCLDF